ncbi:MAG: hypothetical protein PUG16_05770 [Lachnospiraceae bacterium]|nr:hypothetical protein [Lachnospiraceae bacterium]
MLERHYSEGERRALNIVWAAAGNYDLEPPFLAVRRDQADYYMNLVIGLSQKWLDRDALNGFFLSYQGAAKAADFDSLVWLCLENWLYQKELPKRPALCTLRTDYARQYLDNDARLSRQEMMMNDPLVLDLQKYRWTFVMNQALPRLSPHEKKVWALVDYQDPEASTEEVVRHLKEILLEGFHFSDFRMDVEHGFQAAGPMKDLLEKMLHRETHHVDSLLQRQDLSGAGDGEGGSKSAGGLMDKHVSEKTKADQDYIESCFGPCILTDKERKTLENDLCKGRHQYCSLWVTRAGQKKSTASATLDSSEDGWKKDDERAGRHLTESDLVDRQTLEQAKKNQDFYQKNYMQIEASVKKLSAELETVLASFFEPLPISSRAGRLDTEKTYRMPVLRDPEVFTRPGDEVENSLTIDLLLDASASRSPYQETIAAQAYVIAESLNRIHVRTRILDFHSLRGFTVVQILKDYDSPDRTGIFRYAAAGWNRDGLALSLTGRLIEERIRKEGKGQHILLVMTDANPSDSTQVPAQGKDVFKHNYGNEEGVSDTEEAVKKLRQEGLTLGAIYTGPNLYVKNVKRIYRSDFVRIQKVDQLAGGVSRLIQELLVKQGNSGKSLK